MKKILATIIILSNLKMSSQVHQFGAGIGYGEGIDKIKFEGFYSFNYKLLYTKLNYIYTPKKTYNYKNTSQTILSLGIQSLPDYKLIGHINLGARAYFPTKNDNSESYNTQDQPQINIFLNAGASYEFIKHNCLYFDLYIGSVVRRFNYKDHVSIEKYRDIMITIGYAYTFKQKSKVSK